MNITTNKTTLDYICSTHYWNFIPRLSSFEWRPKKRSKLQSIGRQDFSVIWGLRSVILLSNLTTRNRVTSTLASWGCIVNCFTLSDLSFLIFVFLSQILPIQLFHKFFLLSGLARRFEWMHCISVYLLLVPNQRTYNCLTDGQMALLRFFFLPPNAKAWYEPTSVE